MMKMGMILFGVALVAASLGCTPPKADLESARAAVRQADEDLNRAVAAKDMDRFKSLLAEDAVFYGQKILEGREEVASAWSVFFEPEPKVRLRWEPVSATVSAAGDLGYTLGDYVQEVVKDDGSFATAKGHYVTIWRKDPDGAWRAAVDIGTPPEAVSPPESNEKARDR
jgi:uncharacterized protein (TIGR02246 family)